MGRALQAARSIPLASTSARARRRRASRRSRRSARTPRLSCATWASDSSVASRRRGGRQGIGGAKLYGIVNNAGTGLGHGGGAELILNTNLHGPKRVTDAFLPLLDTPGRVVMVGIRRRPRLHQGLHRRGDQTRADRRRRHLAAREMWARCSMRRRGAIACRATGCRRRRSARTRCCSRRTHPQHVFGSCSPGFIATKMAAQ